MKILSILPLTDSFSKSKAGAASLFIYEIDKNTKNFKIIGSTLKKDYILKKKYINIDNIRKFPCGRNNSYIKKLFFFLRKNKFDLIEVHNRPQIARELLNKFKNIKINLYFHNDPITLRYSNTINERNLLLEKCNKIIFLSKWIKDKFFQNLNFYNSEKTEIIYPLIKINKKKLRKEKIIFFAGKLNSAKGYDIFCDTAKIFLKKYKDWKFIVAGDEPRENIIFTHPNFINLGWISYDAIKKYFHKSYITIVPSRWDEPLGRVAIEASKSGSIVIVSNKGGLIETSNNLLILKKYSKYDLFKLLELIINKNNNKTIKNYLKIGNSNLNYNTINKIKSIRKLSNSYNINFNNPIKIIHVADLHIRHNGRLHYSTIKKINNGFIKNNYNLQSFSDRDTKSIYRSINDLRTLSKINNNIKEFVSNFRPDIICFGHADDIENETLRFIKRVYPGIKMSQWFLDPLIKSGPDYNKNFKRFDSKLEFCDANFVTTCPNKINFKNKNIFYLPNPVDATIDVHEIYKNKNVIYDLFLAISHGQHRAALKRSKLDERSLKINKILNSSFVNTNFFGFDKQPVWGDRFFYEMSLCSMALNLSRGNPIKHYSSDRIASLMGNGLLTFIDKKYHFSDFFLNNKEFVEYDNQNDLIDKIIYFKKNIKERNHIARKGKIKYFEIFNNLDISKYIVNFTLGNHYKPKWGKK